MIIGKNFNNQQSQSQRFHQNFQKLQNQNKITNKSNGFVKDLSQHKHVNPTNSNDMHDKTLALLNDRLQKGQITMDEFSKQCRQLGNLRNKN